MGAQLLGKRRLRQISEDVGVEVAVGWSHGGYDFAFATVDHRHGVWNLKSREWKWQAGIGCYTSCRDLPPLDAEQAAERERSPRWQATPAPVSAVTAEELETFMWVDRVMRRPHKPPATWTCRNEPMDRDRKPENPARKVWRQMCAAGAGDYLSIGVDAAARLLGLSEDEVIARFRDDLLVVGSVVEDALLAKEGV